MFREWLYCIWQMTKIQAEENHMLAYTIYSGHPIIRSTERWLPLLYFAKPTNSHTYYVDRSLTFEKFQYSILKCLSDSYASTYIACMHKVFFHPRTTGCNNKKNNFPSSYIYRVGACCNISIYHIHCILSLVKIGHHFGMHCHVSSDVDDVIYPTNCVQK
jgi:hypothetical protein